MTDIASQSEDKSRRIVGDSSNRRLLEGYHQGGFGNEDFGFKISQEGVDVTEANDDQLIMSSAFNMFKIHMTGTATINLSGGSPRTGTQVITHGLGYSPVVVGSIKLPPALTDEVVDFPGQYFVHDGSVFRCREVYEYFAANLNQVTLQVRSDFATGDYIIKYYILIETGAS